MIKNFYYLYLLRKREPLHWKGSLLIITSYFNLFLQVVNSTPHGLSGARRHIDVVVFTYLSFNEISKAIAPVYGKKLYEGGCYSYLRKNKKEITLLLIQYLYYS